MHPTFSLSDRNQVVSVGTLSLSKLLGNRCRNRVKVSASLVLNTLCTISGLSKFNSTRIVNRRSSARFVFFIWVYVVNYEQSGSFNAIGFLRCLP